MSLERVEKHRLRHHHRKPVLVQIFVLRLLVDLERIRKHHN
jgi:hypothetical protein